MITRLSSYVVHLLYYASSPFIAVNLPVSSAHSAEWQMKKMTKHRQGEEMQIAAAQKLSQLASATWRAARQTDRHSERRTDRRMNRQTDEKAGRREDRKRDRQKRRQREKDIHAERER